MFWRYEFQLFGRLDHKNAPNHFWVRFFRSFLCAIHPLSIVEIWGAEHTHISRQIFKWLPGSETANSFAAAAAAAQSANSSVCVCGDFIGREFKFLWHPLGGRCRISSSLCLSLCLSLQLWAQYLNKFEFLCLSPHNCPNIPLFSAISSSPLMAIIIDQV